MTKSVRNLTVFIIGVSFLIGVFFFFWWFTDSFTTWNRFNDTVTEPGNKTIESVNGEEESNAAANHVKSSVTTSSNGALNYDSDVTEYSATVGKFSAPDIKVDGDYNISSPANGMSLKISTFGKYGVDWGDKLTVDIGSNSGFYPKLATYTYEYTDKSSASNHQSDEYIITSDVLGSLLDKISTNDDQKIIYVKATNSAKGDMLSCSSTYAVHYCTRYKSFMVDGATIKAPAYNFGIYAAPAGYCYKMRWGVLAYAGTDKQAATYFTGNFGCGDMQALTGMSAGSAIDKTTYKYKSLHLPEGASFAYYTTDFNRTEDNELAVIDSYYTLDLSQLSYLSSLGSVFTVEFVFYSDISTSVDATLNLQPVPKYTFQVNKLAAPSNVRIEEGILKWDAVPDAEGYAVFTNDECQATVSEPNFTLDGKDKFLGEQLFRIKALGNIGKSFAETNVAKLSFRNANKNITQVVALTYNVSGDTVTKFVPLDKPISGYLYEVEYPDKIFGGWFYDDGFSKRVGATDKITSDTVIYARLTDEEIVTHTPTWWERNMWYVLGPVIGVAVISIVVGIVIGVKKPAKKK